MTKPTKSDEDARLAKVWKENIAPPPENPFCNDSIIKLDTDDGNGLVVEVSWNPELEGYMSLPAVAQENGAYYTHEITRTRIECARLRAFIRGKLGPNLEVEGIIPRPDEAIDYGSLSPTLRPAGVRVIKE